MKRKITIKDCDGFYTILAACVDQGLATPDIYQKLRTAFPDEHMPVSLANVNNWLGARQTWAAFLKEFGREQTELLWAKHQSRLRAWHKDRFRPETLDYRLGLSTERDAPSGITLKRYG